MADDKMSDAEKIKELKIKLAEILNEIAWLMPEDKFYKTFPDTLQFVGEYY